LLVNDAGDERFVRLGEGLQRGEDVRIGRSGLRRAKFGDGARHRGKKLRVPVHDVRGKPDVEERVVRGQRARMLLFVAVRGKQVGAVSGAVNGDFTFRAATHRADFFRLSRAETARLAFLTN